MCGLLSCLARLLHAVQGVFVRCAQSKAKEVDVCIVHAWQLCMCCREAYLKKASHHEWIAERWSAACRDLVNEPRCQDCHPGTIAVSTSLFQLSSSHRMLLKRWNCEAQAWIMLQAWIHEMAAFVKSVDSNHMLTVGEEGERMP